MMRSRRLIPKLRGRSTAERDALLRDAQIKSKKEEFV